MTRAHANTSTAKCSDTRFVEAWSEAIRSGVVGRLAAIVQEQVVIPSDPGDGIWVTVATTVSVEGETSVGYATGRHLTDEVVSRSLSEAIERAVWRRAARLNAAGGWSTSAAIAIGSPPRQKEVSAQYIRGYRPGVDRSFEADLSSTGSAVHVGAERAMSAAVGEVVERASFIRGFHSRQLGTEIGDLPADLIPAQHVRAWWDRRHDLVSIGVLDLGGTPRVQFGTASSRETSLEAALQHAAAEIAQVRPWARRLQSRGRRVVDWQEVVNPESRAAYWSGVDLSVAERLWEELSAENSSEPVEKASFHIVDAAIVTCAGVELYYVRMADLASVYAVHAARREHHLFRALSHPRRFVPHPHV